MITIDLEREIKKELFDLGSQFGYGKSNNYLSDETFIQPKELSKKAHPKQGFKLHVSCNNSEKDLKKVMRTVVPYLFDRKIDFKVTYSLDHMKGTQIGKFLTIYTKSDDNTIKVAYEVDKLLSKSGIRGKGPKIPSDNLIPNSSSDMVYYRFASSGKVIQLPDGRMVEDARVDPVPKGIVDIFEQAYQRKRPEVQKKTVTEKFERPETLDELIEGVESQQEPIISSSGSYIPEEVAKKIEAYASGEIGLDRITRAKGLRTKAWAIKQISEVESMDELIKLIKDNDLEIPSSLGTYSSDRLTKVIEQVVRTKGKDRDKKIANITRTFGLRKTVIKLLNT